MSKSREAFEAWWLAQTPESEGYRHYRGDMPDEPSLMRGFLAGWKARGEKDLAIVWTDEVQGAFEDSPMAQASRARITERITALDEEEA